MYRQFKYYMGSAAQYHIPCEHQRHAIPLLCPQCRSGAGVRLKLGYVRSFGSSWLPPGATAVGRAFIIVAYRRGEFLLPQRGADIIFRKSVLGESANVMTVGRLNSFHSRSESLPLVR